MVVLDFISQIKYSNRITKCRWCQDMTHSNINYIGFLILGQWKPCTAAAASGNYADLWLWKYQKQQQTTACGYYKYLILFCGWWTYKASWTVIMWWCIFYINNTSLKDFCQLYNLNCFYHILPNMAIVSVMNAIRCGYPCLLYHQYITDQVKITYIHHTLFFLASYTA